MNICKECGYDHENPGSVTAGIRVLACALRDYDFITREGKVPKTKEEELKARSQPL